MNVGSVLKEQLTTEGGRASKSTGGFCCELADGAPCATDKNMQRRTDKKLSIKRDSAPARRDFTGAPPINGAIDSGTSTRSYYNIDSANIIFQIRERGYTSE